MRPENLLPWAALAISLCAAGEETSRAAALSAYQNGEYRQAATLLEQALETQPWDADLHHRLGKCYGRIAERSNARNNWLQAAVYSRKTLRQFRRAVQLDGDNRQALRDLIHYLRVAPALLGGDAKEAQRLSLKLAEPDKAQDTQDCPDVDAQPNPRDGRCAQ